MIASGLIASKSREWRKYTVKKTRVDEAHREWRKLNDGFMSHFIVSDYEKEYGPIWPDGRLARCMEAFQHTWLGWHLFGGKSKNERFRAYILGWKACHRRAQVHLAKQRREML